MDNNKLEELFDDVRDLENTVDELDKFIFTILQRLDHLEGRETPYDIWMRENNVTHTKEHIES